MNPSPAGSGAAVAETAALAVESPREVAPPERAGFAANLIPLAVASALMMEFLDSTALSTALPTLARAFHSDPVHLKLALTSYLLALAVFAPASGWVADRYGPRRVFLIAMTVFLVGSGLCGLSRSLPELVSARLVQGAGGAMMTPVGRLIVVGSAPRHRLVNAMTWFSMPGLVGPLLGPPLSGLVLSVASWPWIFYINVPVGIAGAAAVMAFVPRLRQPRPGPFDTSGFALSAVAIIAIVVASETLGVNIVPWSVQLAALAIGVVAMFAFVRHALRAEHPVLDVRLLATRTFRASMIGGSLVRLGIGATPLLLPLLLQIGLGWSPVEAGLLSISMAFGALALKPVAQPILRRIGFRNAMIVSALATGLLSVAPGFFRGATPVAAMAALLALGGFFRSLHFTGSAVLAYADMPKDKISQASTLSTVTQQIAMSLGVSFGGLMLHLARGNGAMTPDRFVLPFLMVGAAALLATPVYLRLAPDAGSDFSGRPDQEPRQALRHQPRRLFGGP